MSRSCRTGIASAAFLWMNPSAPISLSSLSLPASRAICAPTALLSDSSSLPDSVCYACCTTYCVFSPLAHIHYVTYVYLLFGTPGEAEIEVRKTLDFVVRHEDCIGFLNLALFNMPIYGPEARQGETRTFFGWGHFPLHDVRSSERVEQAGGQTIPGQGIQATSCRGLGSEKGSARIYLEPPCANSPME